MTEQQPYRLVVAHPDFELRRYPPCVVAEVTVGGGMSGAGNRAFGALAGYIGGRNHTRRAVAMTAPVVQEPQGRRLSMTSPVVQHDDDASGHVVGFVMPAGESLETLPEPDDDRVRLRAVPAQLAAARRYGGRWTESAYRDNLARLLEAVDRAGLTVVGAPRWARFDPPWTPWFRRHNEVVVPVAGEQE